MLTFRHTQLEERPLNFDAPRIIVRNPVHVRSHRLGHEFFIPTRRQKMLERRRFFNRRIKPHGVITRRQHNRHTVMKRAQRRISLEGKPRGGSSDH